VRIAADERNYKNGSDGVAEEQSARPVTGACGRMRFRNAVVLV
jgi:hypothetical protein